MQPITDHDEKLSGLSGSGSKIDGEDVFIFPATVAQHRFWLLDQLQPGNPALNVPLAARLTGRLDEELIERTINEIVKRHEILRTSFQLREGELAQIVSNAKEILLARFDITQVPESSREARINELMVQEGKVPFDLANGPLLRAGLIKIQAEEYILLLTMHHIGSDGWSNGVAIREVAQIYDAIRENRPLPELPLQYADFAVWQQDWLKTPAAQAEREFWRARLRGILPCLNLPTDYPRKASRGNDSTIHTLLLPAQLTDRLKSYCHSENLTLFMVFCTVYAILLRRYSGQRDITIGTPVANRHQPDLEGLIGLFSNPLLLRLKFSPDLTLHGLINQIKTLSLEVMEHQAYPFEKVVEEIQTDPSRAGLPWLQAYMVFQKAFMLPQQMAGIRLTPLRSISPGAMFDWMLGVLERAEGIRLQMEYNTDLFDQSTIEQALHHFQYLLEMVITGRNFRVDELPVLTPQERQRLVVDWNQASLDSPTGRCIHEQFEEQVRLTPDAPAFQSGENSTSYAALNVRANQLAHFLQSQGLSPGSYIGLVVDHGSIEFVISFLAVLKAGGCCVALDLPDDAALLERLLANSRLTLLVTRGNSAVSLPSAANCQIIDLAQAAHLIGSQAAHNPSVPVADEAPAWVAFTTRSRKGAVIRHRALSYSTSVARREFGLTSQDSVAFSLTEMFPALLSGAKLVGRTGTKKINAGDWWQWVRDQGITMASLPTTGWHELVRLLHSDETKAGDPLRLLAIDGGLISPPALLAWQKIAAGRIRLLDRFWLTEAAGAIGYTEPFTTGSAPGRVSLMRPVSHIRCYLLDEHLQPVPQGVPGSLYVESDYLAVEYFAPTAGSELDFVADPISGKVGSRLLKTGDMGRFLPGSGIELLGRIDELAKTNGFRLELCEIRFTIFQHPAIWDAILMPQKISGKNGLVAYWINRENTFVQPQELQAFLAGKLPAYMVPDAFVPLTAWPLTADGRLDFYSLPFPNTTWPADVNGAGVEVIPEALPVTDVTMTPERRFLERQNYWEQVLGKFWRDVLKLKRVKVTDNFFALGGHSLLAIRLISEINKSLNTKLHVPAFFQNPTIEKLAAWLAREQPLKTAPQLVSLQPGRNEGGLFFLEASIGLCRLAELIEIGPASFTTLVPLAPEAYRAALANDFSRLPDLETLSAPHTALIQNHSFSGPCILVGHSFGGLLMFEVAHQLQRAGRRVDLMLMLDTWAKNPRWWQKLRTVTWKSGWESLSFRSGRLWRRYMAKSTREAQPIKVTTEKNKAAEPVTDGFHLPYAEADWDILSKINRKARRDYQFRPLESRAILFRAKKAESTRFLSIDGSMGWAGLFKDGLEIVDCPGDHLTLLKSPNIQLLAQQFQQSIENLSGKQL